MSVTLKVDPVSSRKLESKFKKMLEKYPEEMYKGVVAILFDIKLIAQKKLKADGHIVTSRLRNSLFVKTPRQKFANRSTNKMNYSYPGGVDKQGRRVPGGSGSRDLRVRVRDNEGAVGTNVIYAAKIEKLDSYLQHGVDTVDTDKRFEQAAKRAEKKL